MCSSFIRVFITYYGLYHILTDKLRLFDKRVFLSFCTNDTTTVGPHFGGKKFQWKQTVAELAGIFVECSFKFISGLKAYDKIYKKKQQQQKKIWRKA